MLNIFKKKKIAIYTAIYGQFEELKQQTKQDMDLDWIFFTDNEEYLTKDFGWKTIIHKKIPEIPAKVISLYQDNSINLGRIEAKYFKCNPHKVLPDYDITIWVDGSAVIKSENFVSEMIKLLGKKQIAFFAHPERNNILDEAIFSKRFGKYKSFDLEKQALYYINNGMPKDFGLLSGGVIIRNNKKSIDFNEAWWNENLKWSYQDQISLMYVLWKLKVDYQIVDVNIWDNKYIAFMSHSRDV